MRWLADECVAAPLVARLREAGLDVTYMAEIAPAATDPEAIARAHHEGRLLLTEDKDFGELVFRWNWPVPGVVLLRIDPEKEASSAIGSERCSLSLLLFCSCTSLRQHFLHRRVFHASGYYRIVIQPDPRTVLVIFPDLPCLTYI